MSWEEMSTKTVKCPCGNGTVSQTYYMDDWNRTKSGKLVINCSQCKENYIVEEEHHHGRTTADGYWTVHYLTPKNYPKYDGITVEKIYPKRDKITFFEFLIISYEYDCLSNALNELKNESAVSRLTGFSKHICKMHKTSLNSARITEVREKVEFAVNHYFDYEDNKDNRNKIEKQYELEYKEYLNEKRKNQIKLDF